MKRKVQVDTLNDVKSNFIKSLFACKEIRIKGKKQNYFILLTIMHREKMKALPQNVHTTTRKIIANIIF